MLEEAGMSDDPGNPEIHARKAQGRRKRAAVAFAGKPDALDALKERVEPIVRAREARRRAELANPGRGT